MNKLLLRKKFLSMRDSLTLKERNKYSKNIAELLYSSLEFKKAKNIFIYLSFNSEVDTVQIIEHSFKLKKRIYVPVILKNREMYTIEIKTLDNLKLNNYGILEPILNDDIINFKLNYKTNDNIDLVIVPGIVFDKKGYRIGYGGGYYDKFFSNNKNLYRIGLSFEIQLIEKIPYEKHDIYMNKIITEKRILKI